MTQMKTLRWTWFDTCSPQSDWMTAAKLKQLCSSIEFPINLKTGGIFYNSLLKPNEPTPLCLAIERRKVLPGERGNYRFRLVSLPNSCPVTVEPSLYTLDAPSELELKVSCKKSSEYPVYILSITAPRTSKLKQLMESLGALRLSGTNTWESYDETQFDHILYALRNYFDIHHDERFFTITLPLIVPLSQLHMSYTAKLFERPVISRTPRWYKLTAGDDVWLMISDDINDCFIVIENIPSSIYQHWTTNNLHNINSHILCVEDTSTPISTQPNNQNYTKLLTRGSQLLKSIESFTMNRDYETDI